MIVGPIIRAGSQSPPVRKSARGWAAETSALFSLNVGGEKFSFGSFVALDETVKSAHPIGMEKIRSAGFILAPQFQLGPTFAVHALVATAWSAGDKAARRHKKRGCAGDAPPLHARPVRLTLISTGLQLPLFGNAAGKIPGNREPLSKIETCECDGLRLGGWTPAHATIAADEQALIGLGVKNERALAGSDNVLHAGSAQPCANILPLPPAIEGHEHCPRAVAKPGDKRIVTGHLVHGDNRLEPVVHLVRIAFPGIFVVERTLVDRNRPGTYRFPAGKRIAF